LRTLFQMVTIIGILTLYELLKRTPTWQTLCQCSSICPCIKFLTFDLHTVRDGMLHPGDCWRVTTFGYLAKNIWPIYTNFVPSGSGNLNHTHFGAKTQFTANGWFKIYYVPRFVHFFFLEHPVQCPRLVLDSYQ